MKRASHVLYRILIALLIVSPQLSLIAQVPQAITGQWTLNLGKRTLFVLTLEPTKAQSGPITGTLLRPLHFATVDGTSFSNVEGPTESDRVVASQWEGNTLTFTTQNPKNASEKTVYKLKLKDQDDVQMGIEGIPLPPLMLSRSKGNPSVSEDWHSGQRYYPDDDSPSNPEMKRLFDEDQHARQSWPNID